VHPKKLEKDSFVTQRVLHQACFVKDGKKGESVFANPMIEVRIRSLAVYKLVQHVTKYVATKEFVKNCKAMYPPDGPTYGVNQDPLRSMADVKHCYAAFPKQKDKDKFGHFVINGCWTNSDIGNRVERKVLETLEWKWGSQYVDSTMVVRKKNSSLYTVVIKMLGSMRNSFSQYFKRTYGRTYLIRNCCNKIQHTLDQINNNEATFKHAVPMVSALFEATPKKHGWTGFVGRCEPGVTKLSALVLPYDPETFSTPARAAAVTEVPSIPEQLEAFFKTLEDGDVIRKKWLEHKAKPSAPVSDDKSNKKFDTENTDDEGNIKKVSLFWV